MNLSSDFETGVDGNTLETTDAGSPDAFNATTGPFAFYSTEHPHSGLLGVKYDVASVHHFDWSGLGALTGDVWCRAYLYLASLPPDNNFYPINFRTSANSSSGIIRVLASGIIQMRDSTNSQIGVDGSIPVATGQLVRIEARINTGADQMEYWLYNTADSEVEDDHGSVSAAITASDIDRIHFGQNVAGSPAGYTHWWDDVAVSDIGKIGPTVTPAGDAGPTLIRVFANRQNW